MKLASVCIIDDSSFIISVGFLVFLGVGGQACTGQF